MAATTHNFTANVSSTSVGKPSFLSNHLEAMCPASQEEDDWMEQQLEKARAERGGFYKRLTNSRTQSSRDIDGSAEKRRAAQAAARDHPSISSTTSSSTTPATTAIPEPHSSWRFYTSFDNGEWKRHCVPVYKPEEEVVGKIQKSAEAVKEEKKMTSTTTSPAYESHLKKYREARANLFDHAPARTRISESMPREQTTTVRVTGAGLHDDMGLYGGGRSGGGGAYGFGSGGAGGGSAAHEMQMRQYGLAGDDLLNGGLPVSFPKQNYCEETSTKEVITTVVGGGGNESGKMKQLMPAGGVGAAGQEHGTRPRKSHNLGYQEKIIIPTKYKSEEERMAIEANLAESSSRLASEQSIAEMQKQKSAAESNREHPSFMGSTFEKFRSDGVPLIRPSFDHDHSASAAQSNSRRSSSTKEAEREQPPQLPRIIPVFDEPSSFFHQPSGVSTNRSTFESLSSSSSIPIQNFERTIAESRIAGSSPFASSTPIASREVATREVNVTPAVPLVKPVFGELSTISHKITMKEQMPDVDRPSLSTGIVRSEDSNVEAYFGNNFGAFPAPTAASIGAEHGIYPALLPHASDNCRTVAVTPGGVATGGSDQSSSIIVPATTASSVADNSVVFIPVIRVTGTPSRQRHTSEITINVNEGATPTTKGNVSVGGGMMPADLAGQFGDILKLHEDNRWIDSEIAKHTPERSTPTGTLSSSSPGRNISVNFADANAHVGQSPSASKSLFSTSTTSNDSGIRMNNQSETVQNREIPVFPSAGNFGTTREINVTRNFSDNTANRPAGFQGETMRYVTNEQQRAVPGKTVEIDRRTLLGGNNNNSESSIRTITATSSSSSSAPMERIIEPRRNVEIKSVVTTGGGQQTIASTQQQSGTREAGRSSSGSTVVEVDDWIVEKAV